MKLSFLAALTFLGIAVAVPSPDGGGGGGDKPTLKTGDPCKKDGSMGNCQSGVCIQTPQEDQGKCK
ncbi:hypothetical protein BDW62DRAFT_204507 [Aspergillus aurantiobrunneus]